MQCTLARQYSNSKRSLSSRKGLQVTIKQNPKSIKNNYSKLNLIKFGNAGAQTNRQSIIKITTDRTVPVKSICRNNMLDYQMQNNVVFNLKPKVTKQCGINTQLNQTKILTKRTSRSRIFSNKQKIGSQIPSKPKKLINDVYL